MEGQPRRRPYWHVDAKWVVGLVLLLVWSATLVGVGLYRLTDKRVAVPLLSTLLATAFSREGLDDAKGLDEFREQLRAAPKQTLRPMPSLAIAVRYEEVAELRPREARLLIARKLAEPLYLDGADGILRLSAKVKPKQAERLKRDTAVIGPLTRASHERLRLPVELLAVTSLVLLALLVRFSAGLGRLMSPGVVLVLAGIPGLVLLAIQGGAGGQTDTLAPGETVGFGYAAREAIPIAFPALTPAYVASLGLGAALILLAMVGRVAGLGHTRRDNDD